MSLFELKVCLGVLSGSPSENPEEFANLSLKIFSVDRELFIELLENGYFCCYCCCCCFC